MKTVRAKFVCTKIEKVEQPKEVIRDVYLMAVADNSDDNKDFTALTPWGELRIGILDDAPASTFFEEGKEYFMDFTEVSKKDS